MTAAKHINNFYCISKGKYRKKKPQCNIPRKKKKFAISIY